MKSKLLEFYGLKNIIGGIDFNFRKKNNPEIIKDVERLSSHINSEIKEIYSCIQVHGNNIEYCDGKNGENFIYGKTFSDTDGLITDFENIGLLIKFADCTPIIIFDPINKVQCSVHSGWRGTVKRISEKGIQILEDEFNSRREDLVVYLGPSIDFENYEVGLEVYDAFKDFKNRDEFFKRKNKNKFLLSMIDGNLDILKENGIKEKNIEVSRISTFNNQRLNSARRQGDNYKLNGILSTIKKS